MFDVSFLIAAANAAANVAVDAANAVANTAVDAANAVAPAAEAVAEGAAPGPEGAEGAAKITFGPWESIVEGGPVAWTIAAIMLIMSVVSWYITITKYFEQSKILKQAREGIPAFWRAGSVQEGAGKLDKNSPFRQVVDDGMRAESEHGQLTDPMDQHEWVHTSLNRTQDAINSKLSSGLSFLATVGSTSPFVGLLGTVIGITNALVKIAAKGQADIAAIAGPVGEALYMTAFGLIVAVPAVMAYNWLQRRNKQISERLGTFSNDLHGYMMSGGKVRPSVKAAAAAPAKK
jgi:biopolymer transport protein ExbB